jgi:transitional endoplasmic reticulum ATPase
VDLPAGDTPDFSDSRSGWHVRDFHQNDMEQVVRLYEQTRDLPDSAPLNLVDLVTSLRSSEPSVVAVAGRNIVGISVADLRGDRATLLGLRIHPAFRGRGIGSELLRAVEDRVIHSGVRRIEALLGAGQVGGEALIKRGFQTTVGLTLFVKDEPLAPAQVDLLDSWGGELIEPTAWDAIAGMHELKDLIEARVVRPILEDDLARNFGLHVPATVMLFGPPGTGKTSFARGVAGRLGWPFVELLPAKLAASENGLAEELSRALKELAQLEHVVAFIDEFDEIGGSRSENRENQAVVNTLLKAIPQFRSQSGRLLVCATNFIEHLDPAVIRTGRFDLIIPIGPPDEAARNSLWRSTVSRMYATNVDFDDLVDRSANYTPADVVSAAQRAAFAGFSRSTNTENVVPLTTDDFIRALALTRPSLSQDSIAEFGRSAEAFGRC